MMGPEAPSAALSEFLKSPDATCPACGYALTGLSVNRCPECGSALRLVLASAHGGVSVAASLVLLWGLTTGLLSAASDLWIGWSIFRAGVPTASPWEFFQLSLDSPFWSASALWSFGLILLSGGWQLALMRRRGRGISRRMRRATTVVCAVVLFSVPFMFLLETFL